ncbi:hypothetical protein L7F22_038064 [Adiantum nelumboides]|nr:hypothetical protein [Adiantum nelumboides]
MSLSTLAGVVGSLRWICPAACEDTGYGGPWVALRQGGAALSVLASSRRPLSGRGLLREELWGSSEVFCCIRPSPTPWIFGSGAGCSSGLCEEQNGQLSRYWEIYSPVHGFGVGALGILNMSSTMVGVNEALVSHLEDLKNQDNDEEEEDEDKEDHAGTSGHPGLDDNDNDNDHGQPRTGPSSRGTATEPPPPAPASQPKPQMSKDTKLEHTHATGTSGEGPLQTFAALLKHKQRSTALVPSDKGKEIAISSANGSLIDINPWVNKEFMLAKELQLKDFWKVDNMYSDMERISMLYTRVRQMAQSWKMVQTSTVCKVGQPMPNVIRSGHICGRPLGLRFNKEDGDLYVADAYWGLLKVGQQGGQATQSVSEVEGFTNDLDITSDGLVYFTDSSSKYQRRNFFLLVLSGDDLGRPLKYNPKSGEAKVVVRGLQFPNGAALSKNESFLVIAESVPGRLLRHWLKGPKKGETEVMAMLPGYPDNVRVNDQGDFWVAMHCRRNLASMISCAFPWLRRALLQLIATTYPFQTHISPVQWWAATRHPCKVQS